MKKIAFIVALLTVFAFAGCSAAVQDGTASQSAQPSILVPPAESVQPSASAQPSESGQTSAGAQEPNVWVVRQEAPVMDADTGKEAGRAYPGFMLSIQNENKGLAGFSLNFLDEKGQNVSQTKKYTIDTKYMQKEYVEPQATILIISIDMIKLKAGGSFYDGNGQKLITFNDATGPFHFIQKTEKGYMMTIDFNVVYAKEGDVDLIPVPNP